MANFMSNAAKYSPPGGRITIASKLHDGAVRISVSDQGPGIPADFRHRIFERFAQADANGKQGKKGTGLGLSIAKAIVEAHGGTIGFDTTEGKGATFYFEIPVSHVTAARHRLKRSALKSLEYQGRRSSGRVPRASCIWPATARSVPWFATSSAISQR